MLQQKLKKALSIPISLNEYFYMSKFAYSLILSKFEKGK